MSSTTDESDWNTSYGSRQPPAIEEQDNSKPSTITSIPSQTPNVEESNSLPTPRPESVPNSATPIPGLKVQDHPFSNAATPDTLTYPIKSTATPIVEESVSRIDQSTPEWEAARESVLSQMITSQDIAVTPTPTITRGGVKTGGRRGRGGRRPKIKVEAPQNAANLVTIIDGQVRGKNRGGRPRGSRAGASGMRGVNRGGRPRGSRAGVSSSLSARPHKRKRKNADGDTEDEEDDTDASEEITTLPAQSRSGRRIIQAATFSPVVIDPEASRSANKRPSAIGDLLTPGGKRPKRKRLPGATSVCINCGRGHSPASNQIVFCDGCNTAYHQYCHDRPITPSVILIEEKEWYCATCAGAVAGPDERLPTAGKAPAEEAAVAMSFAHKRDYLQSLEKEELVSLLLHASTLHPDFLIFPPLPSTTTFAPTPVSVSPAGNTIPTVRILEAAAAASFLPAPPPPPPIIAEPDPGPNPYDAYLDEEPLPYPRAGNGIPLPPENEDLDILIDEEVVTYSHSWIDNKVGGWVGAMRGGVVVVGVGA